MMKVKAFRSGLGFTVETNAQQESITDYSGTTTFLYLTKQQAEDLYVGLWQAMFDSEIKGVMGA